MCGWFTGNEGSASRCKITRDRQAVGDEVEDFKCRGEDAVEKQAIGGQNTF